jgi:hypothetical protein
MQITKKDKTITHNGFTLTWEKTARSEYLFSVKNQSFHEQWGVIVKNQEEAIKRAKAILTDRNLAVRYYHLNQLG